MSPSGHLRPSPNVAPAITTAPYLAPDKLIQLRVPASCTIAALRVIPFRRLQLFRCHWRWPLISPARLYSIGCKVSFTTITSSPPRRPAPIRHAPSQLALHQLISTSSLYIIDSCSYHETHRKRTSRPRGPHSRRARASAVPSQRAELWHERQVSYNKMPQSTARAGKHPI